MTEDDVRAISTMIERLQDIRDRLDLSRRQCNSCGLQHYRNNRDWRLAEKLDGAIGRLVKALEDHSPTSAAQGDNRHAKTEAHD